MATIYLWRGHRSFVTGYSDCETVIINALEIGSVRFTDADGDVQYRIFRDEDGYVTVFFVERRGYDCTAEVYEYPSVEAAAKEYKFVLKKAGVI